MKLIKLDAIDSTNDFLKAISNDSNTPNFTVVTAEEQTKGKGQMGQKWVSEKGKNLITSVLVKGFVSDIRFLFHLNVVFSLAVVEVLENYKVPDLSIKWPNDIMSYNKKIGGILIENSIKSNSTIDSVVGLGLNVNQLNFDNLPRASSMAVLCGCEYDKELLLFDIVEKFKEKIVHWQENANEFWSDYTNLLFKRGIPTPFVTQNQKPFMGIILGVSQIGKLLVLLEDDTTIEYDVKDVQMLY